MKKGTIDKLLSLLKTIGCFLHMTHCPDLKTLQNIIKISEKELKLARAGFAIMIQER